jgi:hypothetical protein
MKRAACIIAALWALGILAGFGRHMADDWNSERFWFWTHIAQSIVLTVAIVAIVQWPRIRERWNAWMLCRALHESRHR